MLSETPDLSSLIVLGSDCTEEEGGIQIDSKDCNEVQGSDSLLPTAPDSCI